MGAGVIGAVAFTKLHGASALRAVPTTTLLASGVAVKAALTARGAAASSGVSPAAGLALLLGERVLGAEGSFQRNQPLVVIGCTCVAVISAVSLVDKVRREVLGYTTPFPLTRAMWKSLEVGAYGVGAVLSYDAVFFCGSRPLASSLLALGLSARRWRKRHCCGTAGKRRRSSAELCSSSMALPPPPP